MTAKKELKVRLPIEIARYHDILDDILHNPEIKNNVNWIDLQKSQEQLLIIKRTLCWVLMHDAGRWLSDNMENLHKQLEAAGFHLTRLQ